MSRPATNWGRWFSGYVRERDIQRLVRYQPPYRPAMKLAARMALWAHVAVFLLLFIGLAAAAGAQTIPRDAQRHQATLKREAQRVWGINAPVATFAAQVHQESRWRENARSPVGAIGLAQFMPATSNWIGGLYASLGDRAPTNPTWALRALVTYDRWLADRVKAVDTSQAMIGEQLEVGSRAAADTAQVRQNSVHDSDRDIAAAGMNQIFAWITEFNFGADVAPPTLKYFKQEKAGKDRAEAYDMARKAGAKPSKKAMLAELAMPAAEDDADALLPDEKPVAKPPAPEGKTKLKLVNFSAVPGYTFAKAVGMTDDQALQLATAAADAVLEDQTIEPIARMLAEFEADGKTLAEFNDALQDVVGQLDDQGLREVLDRALSYSILRGAATDAP